MTGPLAEDKNSQSWRPAFCCFPSFAPKRNKKRRIIMQQRTVDCGDGEMYDNVSWSFIDRQSLGRTFLINFEASDAGCSKMMIKHVWKLQRQKKNILHYWKQPHMIDKEGERSAMMSRNFLICSRRPSSSFKLLESQPQTVIVTRTKSGRRRPTWIARNVR